MKNEPRACDTPPLTREMLLAWHLRDDIRAGRSLDDPETRLDFRLWWLSSAHLAFPAMAEPPHPEDVRLAGDIVRPATGPDDAAVTRLMDAVARLRKDDAPAHDSDTVAGRRTLAVWYYVCVVPELSLFPLLDARERAWLLEPVSPPLPPFGLAPTRLARLTWESRTDVRAAIDLDSPEGPLDLLAWYWTYGVREMRHQGYCPWQETAALTHPTADSAGLAPLDWLAWWADASARTKFNPATPEGRAGLRDWLRETGLAGQAAAALRPGDDSRRAAACALPPRHPFGANIIGYARGELGIGEDSRMCALSLGQAETPFAVVNIPVGSNTRENDAYLDGCLSEDAPYPVNIFCLTGLDTARMWLERGRALFSGRVNIGYWPWELPVWPEAMAGAYELVDELWVSSAYTRDAFAKTAPVPVRLMPMAVSVDRIRPLPRSAFGLPEDRFLFLYTFDCNSYLARKHPLAAIETFQAAFPRGDEPVGLVLKTMNARDDDPRWAHLARAAARDARILFLHGTMDRGDVLGLFAACDAYVSPHRAEGFGRTLAEAMLLGKPVVATGYSGNADFLTPATGFPVPYRLTAVGPDEYPFGHGLLWAEPDADALAGAMRRAVREPELARRRAAAGQELIASRHHPLAVGRAYRERLLELAARAPDRRG